MFMEENLLTLEDAIETLPTKPSLTTLRRWCRTGLRGILLESRMLAGRRVTSHESLIRFFDAVEAARRLQPRIGFEQVASSSMLDTANHTTNTHPAPRIQSPKHSQLPLVRDPQNPPAEGFNPKTI